jgi:nucleoid-associated protein YgaU
MTTIADRTGEPITPPMVNSTLVGDLTISQTPTPDQTLGTDTLRGNQQPSPDATPIDKQIDKAKVANGTNGLEVKPFGGGETIRVASKDIVLPEPKPAPGQPKTETTDEKWYTVAAGDSAFKIAKKFYGKGEYWKQLQAYNGNRIGTDGSVRVGVRVKVPEAAKLGIKDAPVVKADEKVATKTLNKPEAKAAEGPKADPKPETSGRSYTVKKGDTLGQIAQRELGTMKRADEIVKLNKLKSASSIREGMKLSLPTK